jgi:tetratricopeptide (TPR) repeat protein
LNRKSRRIQEKADKKNDDRHHFASLGIHLSQLGDTKKAIRAFKSALKADPKFYPAHYNIGVLYQGSGKFNDAVASYQHALKIKPDYAEAYNNLGITLQALGRLDEGEASFTQAIAFKPDYAEAHYNLGVTHHELGKLEDSQASYTQAIALKPDYAEAHYNLGNTHKELGRLEEAEASYTQAIAFKPDFSEAHTNLGNTLKELFRLDEAEASLTQAIALNPNCAETHRSLGVTLQVMGRLNEAEASLMQAIALNPECAKAHRSLTLMKTYDSQDEQYSKMVELYLDKNISEEQRCHINFGLAKACEDLGDFEKAFAHYSEGNMLRKKILKYNINQDVELFKKIKSNHSRIISNSLEPDKLFKDPKPIFIVGMPRSGTTLVEQIISSHSKVTGAGELSFAPKFGAAIAKGSSELNYEAVQNFRTRYLTKLMSVSKGNSIVTDKMPQNFLYLGLIASAFPEAKIVHVKRNSAAVCWSNYKQYFFSKYIGYCYAIDDVLSYYKMYENLMEFWENSLSKIIYNLDYERLIANQESETRQLINYLGLDWDEKCLSPQDNMRSVETASNLQVRKKVYQGSSQEWKRYEPFLNGRLDGLK